MDSLPLARAVVVVVLAAAPPGSQDASRFRAHSSEIQAFLAFQVETWGVTEVSSVGIKVSTNRAWRSLLPSGGIAVVAGFEWIPRGSLCETRVEEGTAALVEKQGRNVINKDEMIDVIGCTRGRGYKGVVTRWSAPGCRGRHIVVSGRMRVLERGIHPAFSGKCAVQVNQVSIIETMLDEAREECNRLELQRWRLKEENRLSEAQLWSETGGHLLTELGSLRDQRA